LFLSLFAQACKLSVIVCLGLLVESFVDAPSRRFYIDMLAGTSVLAAL